ncbi:TPA: hypothetical protein ACG6RF_002048 [Streptococcus agalactiae]|nr:hypothetical protein [Streptococcus agalactiae]HEO2267426.1 hypothetical protein [Streptococcus agalactiae]HEO7770428.1 hypothetical protein [Streptococcus agalactiae]
MFTEEEQSYIEEALRNAELGDTETYILTITENGITGLEAYTEYGQLVYQAISNIASKAIENRAFDFDSIEELITNGIIFDLPKENLNDFYDKRTFMGILENYGIDGESIWENTPVNELYYHYYDLADDVSREVNSVLDPYYEKLHILERDLLNDDLYDMIMEYEPKEIYSMSEEGFIDYLASSEDYSSILLGFVTSAELREKRDKWYSEMTDYEISELIAVDDDLSSQIASNIYASRKVEEVIEHFKYEFDRIARVGNQVLWVE